MAEVQPNDQLKPEEHLPVDACPQSTMELSTEILIMIGIMLISIIGGNILRKSKSRFLQEAGLTTLIGILAGLIFLFLDQQSYMENLQQHFRAIFLIMLLPSIILESGFNMKKSSFYKNLGTVLMYAFVGTFIAMLSLGLMIKALAQTTWTPEFTWRESFAFSALISATDPVTVLAIFKEINTDLGIYTLVFGESIFNDAICIVMYRTITEFEFDESKNLMAQFLAPFAQFMILFVGSFLIGAISALIIGFILKKAKRSKTIKINNEISMMVLWPWISYLIAEGLKLSGIVSILINGVFLAQYVAPNLSQTSKKVVKAGYETVAWGAEAIVFLFIGIGMFGIDKPFEQIGFMGIISACVMMNIARLLNIGIISALCNLTRKENKITFKFQLVMWIAGLRGAMAYALALESFVDYSTGKVMLVITLIYALFSVLVIGSIFNPIIAYIGIEKTEEDLQTQLELDDSFYGPDNIEKLPNWGERLKMKLFQFNTNYFKPIFVVNSEEAENVADPFESIPSHSTTRKRKSDSVLFEVNLHNSPLEEKNIPNRLSLEADKIGENNSF